MRAVLATLALAAAILAFPAWGSGQPALRLLSSHPLEVQGLSFKAGERVLVRVELKGVRVSQGERTVVAGRSGGFRLVFPNLTLGRCAQPFVWASGSKGSKATLRVPRMACLPA